MTKTELQKLKNGDLVWVAVSRRKAHAVYFCEFRENGVYVEDWAQGFPIHSLVPFECVIAPYSEMKVFEENKA